MNRSLSASCLRRLIRPSAFAVSVPSPQMRRGEGIKRNREKREKASFAVQEIFLAAPHQTSVSHPPHALAFLLARREYSALFTGLTTSTPLPFPSCCMCLGTVRKMATKQQNNTNVWTLKAAKHLLPGFPCSHFTRELHGAKS